MVARVLAAIATLGLALSATADEPPQWLPQLVVATDLAQLRRQVFTVRIESPPWASTTAFASGGLGFGDATDSEFGLGAAWYPVLARFFDLAIGARVGLLDHRTTRGLEGEQVGIMSTGAFAHAEAALRWWWLPRSFAGLTLGGGFGKSDTTARCCGGIETTSLTTEAQFAVGVLVGVGFGRLDAAREGGGR